MQQIFDTARSAGLWGTGLGTTTAIAAASHRPPSSALWRPAALLRALYLMYLLPALLLLNPPIAQAQTQTQTQTQTQPAQPHSEACDQQPVYMVVSGLTLDVQRMNAYGQAIRESGLYAQLGGYYINLPRPVAVFEGEVADNHVSLMVRFPCLANARAFWYSQVYQQQIRPLRLNPSAGDYTVTVYREGTLPDYLQGAVGSADYQRQFDASGIIQAEDAGTR